MNGKEAIIGQTPKHSAREDWPLAWEILHIPERTFWHWGWLNAGKGEGHKSRLLLGGLYEEKKYPTIAFADKAWDKEAFEVIPPGA